MKIIAQDWAKLWTLLTDEPGCESLARQRYNVLGKLSVKPKEISTASVRDLCLFIGETGLRVERCV